MDRYDYYTHFCLKLEWLVFVRYLSFLWSLGFLQSGPLDHPQLHVPLSRGAVSSVPICSTYLLYYVEPLPLDQMLNHDVQAVRDWPEATRNKLLAVAHRDVAISRRNLADMTRYFYSYRSPCGVFRRLERLFASDVGRDFSPYDWGDLVSSGRDRPADVTTRC